MQPGYRVIGGSSLGVVMKMKRKRRMRRVTSTPFILSPQVMSQMMKKWVGVAILAQAQVLKS
eukprot:9167837-Karenia_brevis.AAC.1